MANASPVSLSYVAALRGVRPRAPAASFRYLNSTCRDTQGLICLAASNPDGSFIGVVPDDKDAAVAHGLATARRVFNISFVAGTPSSLINKTESSSLDYLVADDRHAPLSPDERNALFKLAEKTLKPSGLFAYSYRAYAAADAILRFLIAEYAPSMDKSQAAEFLHELKALGTLYFTERSDALAALENALSGNAPEAFFAAYGKKDGAASGTFDVLAALLPLGFAFAGAADISANYMELSTPPQAHDVLMKCRGHLLYEPIKDFAMSRLERHDIWCRLPADRNDDLAELFGRFTFGMTMPREQVPSSVKACGKIVDLKTPLLANMIEVMTLLPMCIGDFLHHPLGKGALPSEVIDGLHVLAALGIAQPMRGHHQSSVNAQIANLKWATDYNRYFDTAPITERQVLLASQVVGGGVCVSARDALVMQAINRAGFSNCAGALFSELERIARDPALAAQIMDTDPTYDMADNMVQDVVSRAIIRWYAYGVLVA